MSMSIDELRRKIISELHPYNVPIEVIGDIVGLIAENNQMIDMGAYNKGYDSGVREHTARGDAGKVVLLSVCDKHTGLPVFQEAFSTVALAEQGLREFVRGWWQKERSWGRIEGDCPEDHNMAMQELFMRCGLSSSRCFISYNRE